MSIYSGVIRSDDNTATLDANGIIIRLQGDISLFRPLNGFFIAVQGEQQGDAIINAVPVNSPESAASGTNSSADFNPIISAIKANEEKLIGINGVIALRPGFSKERGMESTPVIVIITDQETKGEAIPVRIDGFGAETRNATVLELTEGILPLSAWETDGMQEWAEAAPGINYVPPPASRVELSEMEVSNITCHVGPDSGWSTLKPFLEGTSKSLTVAMYEFYADHIIETMTTLGQDPDVTLDIILQVDSKDKDCKSILEATWGDRLTFVAASVSGPNRIFNNSYHTKVAVRDSKEVWVSSGNWSPNSQPLINQGSENSLYTKGNREWHVIIKDKNIAVMYEKFIKYDMEKAEKVAGAEMVPDLPDLLIPESFFEAEAAVIQPHPFDPKTFADNGEKVKIRPLMSPDNYANEILRLIKSAQKSLYLQFSYINQPSAAVFDEIINAVAEKMQAGLDVRVIVGSNQKPTTSDLLIGKRKWKRSMFRQQKSKLHNKGVLVDGKIAVVGSNNWSSDGTQYNRDTSLVFYSKPIAQYYTEVFMFDWDNLTKPVGMPSEIEPILAPETGSTPQGMVRIPWKAWFND